MPTIWQAIALSIISCCLIQKAASSKHRGMTDRSYCDAPYHLFSIGRNAIKFNTSKM